MPDEKPKPVYKYKVIDRCFKENALMTPLDAKGQLVTFESETVYVSRALEPANEETAKAVEAQKIIHAAHYKKAAPISNEEAADLRTEVTDLKAQLAEAIGMLKQAAASKK